MNIFKKSKKEDKLAPTENIPSKEESKETSNPHDNGGCCGHCGGQDK